MRTTVDLDERVLAAARSRAKATGVSLGAAISELVLRGLSPRSRQAVRGERDPVVGFPVLAGVEGHVITDEMVAEALDEL
jgi:hypothetical protein